MKNYVRCPEISVKIAGVRHDVTSMGVLDVRETHRQRAYIHAGNTVFNCRAMRDDGLTVNFQAVSVAPSYHWEAIAQAAADAMLNDHMETGR